MRGITINRFQQPQRGIYDPKGIYYTVMLGNYTIHKFTTKQETISFLAETSKVLTQHLHEVNMYLGELTAEYRRVWPYFEGRNADNETLAKTEERIKFGLQEADRCIEFIMAKGWHPSFNLWAFESLGTAYSGLQTTTDGLIEIYLRRSQNAEANRYRVTAKLLSYSRLQLSEYGKNRANVQVMGGALSPNDRYYNHETGKAQPLPGIKEEINNPPID